MKRAFTLIELLVVVAIIVILLAILIPGLEKALKASERAKCGANQRNVAQQLTGYALEYERTFVPAVGQGVIAQAAYDLRDTVGMTTGLPLQGVAGSTVGAVGIGYLVSSGRLPSTKLGEIMHCPSLDTSSGAPVNLGADVPLWTDNDPGSSPVGMGQMTNNQCAGASFWIDAATTTAGYRIVGGYYYRGLSYANTKSGSAIRVNVANSSFALTSDLVSATATDKYGRDFHHVTGWNVSYGDGHAAFFSNEKSANGGVSRIELDVLVDAMGNPIEMNGRVNPAADEAVYKEFGKGSK